MAARLPLRNAGREGWLGTPPSPVA